MADHDLVDENAVSGYTTQTFSIPEFRVEQAIKRLKQLSVKAQSLGMPPFGLQLGEPTFVKARGEYGMTGGKIAMLPLTVTGGPPIIPGWRFFAKIDHDEGMNIVQGFSASNAVENTPGLLKQLQSCSPNCDHCDLKRSRNTTFLFEKTDNSGERIQVGSSCVEDFSGHKSPEQIVAIATRWSDLIQEFFDDEGMDGYGSSRPSDYDVKAVLAVGAAVIRSEGHWISREASGGHGASVDIVRELLCDPKLYMKVVSDGDRQTAKTINDWLCSDDFDDKGNLYRSNLQAMALRGAIPLKQTGFFASAAAAWRRDQVGMRQKEANPTVSLKLGVPGEKVSMDATVEKIIPLDNMYGISYLTILKDNETNAKATWFNSGVQRMHEGDTYNITGTVKKHEERDGVWQTMLSRVTSPECNLMKLLTEKGTFNKAFEKKLAAVKHINSRDRAGETALYEASRGFAYDETDRRVVMALLEAGADPSIQSLDRQDTILDHWILSGDSELIHLGLEKCPVLTKPWDVDSLADCDKLSEENRNAVSVIRQQVLEAEAKPAVANAAPLERATDSSRNTDAMEPPAAPANGLSTKDQPELFEVMEDDESDLSTIRIG